MPCDKDPTRCRRDHVAPRLIDAVEDGGDYEARCPACGHSTFRVSKPDRSKRLRHVWTCACKGQCQPGTLRGALLRLGISPACLGIYDGDNAREIPAEVARAMDRTIDDILSMPGIKLQDVRLLLADAQGRKIPEDYTGFVKFAKGIGLAHQQAYEAARREFCRPSDCPPSNRGEVVDTSRNTEQGNYVKPRRSRHRRPT